MIDEYGDITELSIWRVPITERNPSGARYRLAFVRHDDPKPVVLYDNHHPKGHHRHVTGVEEPYEFENVDKLISDFQADVSRVKGERR
ncbi:MAG: hypothetical protein HYY35_08225 [Deltaproteobacteria bacterium]|nr:hypothetical protein [Deltaproteobacteria bacterium]